MYQNEIEKCFVVMPFGKKPRNDGTHRMYDFEKVYRIIIRRAIQEAGMESIRADETKGSRIIHTDMFKDLRDRPIVLADLSLNNPNVFYELGIRHVMSPKGTVLLCCSDTELPFDVKLSRTIFYKFDGESLDWEEVERVVRELASALKEAKSGKPDSPVHALLERVMPNQEQGTTKLEHQSFDQLDQIYSQENYQRMVADFWSKGEQSLAELQQEHEGSVFGIRSLAYLCLKENKITANSAEIARQLYSKDQYDLAIKVYEEIDKHCDLEIKDLLNYGSSISELDPTLKGIECALPHINKALENSLNSFKAEENRTEDLRKVTQSYNQLAGLCLWKWKLSKGEKELDIAIDIHKKADQYSEAIMDKDPTYPLGEVAYNKLKLMIMLRIKDRDTDRVDTEGYRDGTLNIKIPHEQHPRDASYLRWYQIIAIADTGDEESLRQHALIAFTEDTKILDKPGCSTIGRRQYKLLRRFLEQYSSQLRHPTLIGYISQILQIGLKSRT